MTRFLALLALVSLLTACANPFARSAAASSVPRCATLQAQALVSPNAPVAGVFDCLSTELAQTAGFTSDTDIQLIAAQEPVFTSYRYLGHTATGYYFEFSARNVVAGCFRFHVDASGHVDKAGSKQGACPLPLP